VASTSYFATVAFADDRALGVPQHFPIVVGIGKNERLSFVCNFPGIEQQTNGAGVVCGV
jgi:hypothetical protein